jgi:GNAT superfamily N-acetyltransferase
MRDLGVKGVEFEVEWITADNPCPKCSAMSSKIYSIEEAHGLIPLHPSCRCKWLPVKEDSNGRMITNVGHGKGSGIPGPIAEDKISDLIGKKVTERELVESLVPIEGGKSEIEHIILNGKPAIRVTVNHEMFHMPCIRVISRDYKGELFVKNESIDVKQEHQGKGIGSTLFINQVSKCKSLGVSYFSSHLAEGQRAEMYPGVRVEGPNFTGYFVWPSLGYDQNISDIKPRNMGDKRHQAEQVLGLIKKEFPHAKTIQDIYHTEGGRQWWKDNGVDLTNAKFDLKDGSKSLEILNKYIEGRRKVGR